MFSQLYFWDVDSHLMGKTYYMKMKLTFPFGILWSMTLTQLPNPIFKDHFQMVQATTEVLASGRVN